MNIRYRLGTISRNDILGFTSLINIDVCVRIPRHHRGTETERKENEEGDHRGQRDTSRSTGREHESHGSNHEPPTVPPRANRYAADRYDDDRGKALSVRNQHDW